MSGRLLPFVVGFSSFAAPLNELFVFAFPRFRALLSHRRAGGFLFSNCGPKRGITSKQEQGQAQRHGGRAMRYVCCWILRVFVADFGRSEVDFLALFTRRAGRFFFKILRNCDAKRGVSARETARIRARAWRTGDTVRLSSKRAGFYCGYSST